jgi:hypothetical protein
METLSQTPPELAADIYRYLSCWWRIYVKRFDKEFLKKQIYLFTLPKIH